MRRYITEGLEEYLGNENCPWHMPGHKRRGISDNKNADRESDSMLSIDGIIDLAMSMDVTEVPGTDDLHHPEGIIKSSMNELKNIYRTYSGYYLVNGSTCGIMAAVAACTAEGSAANMPVKTSDSGTEAEPDAEKKDIIVARNCHKSVYNVIELLKLRAIYVKPEPLFSGAEDIPEIYGSVKPDKVEALCRKYKGIRAMVITSPTYEGVVSDIVAISRILDKYDIKLIVDEAHGAHLPFMNETPDSAIYCGADIVIQSLHKTLPSLTQTGILHVMDASLDERVRKYLSVFQSSSPSYVLLCSMERAVAWAAEQDFSEYYARLSAFRKKVSGLKNIGIVDRADVKAGGACDYDETRIVIYARLRENDNYIFMTGISLAESLKKYGNIVCEMTGNDYVILISSILDNEKDFEHLGEVLMRIDEEISSGSIKASDLNYREQSCDISEEAIYRLVGSSAIDDIYVYPPGSYILTTGELITEEIAETLIGYIRSGRCIRGSLFDI